MKHTTYLKNMNAAHMWATLQTRTASCLPSASVPRAGARGSLPGDLFSTHEDADDLEEEVLKESAGALGFAPVVVGSS